MPAGRPSSFSDELAETICDLLSDGLSMVTICERDDMPHRRTVQRWLENNADFATRCAHARALQADLMDHMIQSCADRCTPESAPADRVKISAYQWRAAKLLPRVYGDKVAHTGPDGGAILLVTGVLRGDDGEGG